MKTVLIDCSPKKRMSASGFIASMTGVFLRGKREKEKLRVPADHARILEKVKDADNAVFSMPLYVDGVPSHVLPFLKEAEEYCRENGLHPNVYVIANNGFIEGRQNEPLMRIMENFCDRAGLIWKGGLGIGGGVMMNVMRIMITVFFALMLTSLILSGFGTAPLITFGQQLLSVLLLGCGIIAFDLRLAACINRGKNYGKHYTRIMVPSFVFILFADIFFTVLSVFQGGIFRGWLKAKKPETVSRKQAE